MLKQFALATALTCTAFAASAQTTPQTTTPQTTQPPARPEAGATVKTDAADAKNLIGRNVQNRQNETVGEIKSVFIGPDGKVDSVMVGVGGFLGIGEREVQLRWKDLQVTDGGRKVVVDMTKDQLKALPEYKYGNTAWRGQVFDDRGPYRGTAASDRAPSAGRDPAATGSTASSGGHFNAKGGLSADAVIGAEVKNQAKETVGTVEDVYLDKSGNVQEVVVSVGGFLGVGNKHVAVKWSDIQFGRDGNSLMLTTNWTKNSLKAMPEHKYERREQAQQR